MSRRASLLRALRCPAAWPAGGKLAALFALSLLVFYCRNLWVLGGFCAAALLLYAAAGFGARRMIRAVRLFAALALALAVFQFFLGGFAAAAEAGLRLFALLSLAAWVSATTAASALLAAMERGLRCFAPLGLNPRKTALALALALRFLPMAEQTRQELRAARLARGGAERLPLRDIAPLTAASLASLAAMHGQIADALEARGADDPAPPRKARL